MGQKKPCNLLGLKKITQALGTQSNKATSQDKNQSRNLLRREKQNHATSQDQKKSCHFSGQKNHATSLDKKITKPLGTKKNNATSWDK